MKLLKDMKDSGTEYVVMEVSSHALDRKRVSACHFDAAIFTNLTQDHLDYHVNMENYFEAKKRLFTEVLEASEKRKKFAIINLDDAYGARIAKCSAGEVISFSTKSSSAVVHAERATISEQGIWADVNTPWGRIELHSKLFGIHNLSNILAASAAALSLGASPSSVESGVSRIISVPGRLDRVENTKGINVLVDYAHTPDALKNVLSAVRPLTPGSLILVFGCGGDRDPLKRPVMGRIGRELSDVLIVTSDNPRTEPPESIIDQIERGVFEAVDARKSYFRVTDRRQAIEKAIRIAQKGDTVLIAGKGHEDYQILGTEKIHFDDKEVAREILSEIDKEECLN
jgi:UDP-N-acetylmuramyl-tripeptide synthetase